MLVKSDVEIEHAVAISLREDIGDGDITAELIAADANVSARVIARESAVICGVGWVEEVYRQLGDAVSISWALAEGDEVAADEVVATLQGPARALVTGERSALNWLQTLSGTATVVRQYTSRLNSLHTALLDTRKTIPGLRYAQKYAVKCGGGKNHRMGLYDAYLIKENHISSCGGIVKAVAKARLLHADKPVEVEVETMDELAQALEARSDIIMLDNFDLVGMIAAVELNNGRAKLEVSGNVTLDGIDAIAKTGVDFISIGALTKHLRAVDFSMRII
jgi:nicotinate-nucleotide pyrophosphorylase (carboxylating)